MSSVAKSKSRTLFFLGCIPARMFLAYIAYILSDTCCETKGERVKQYRLYFAALTFVIGVSFMAIYLMGWRQTGRETFGQPIWWNSFRPIHSVLYIAFSIGLLMNVKNIYMLLVFDILVGIYAELCYKK